jgi:myo-inositol 2-dehydrogenase / D-chiro-inositol 1-dehydrogenase
MNLGLIGCGTIAYYGLVPAIRTLRGVRLVAVADPDAAARARVRTSDTAGDYADAVEMLARRDLDAVVIAAPTHLHADLALAVADSGRPFYLEKPIATTAADAARITAAAASRHLRAMVGFNWRFHPVYARARDLVRAGRLGPIVAIQSAFCETIAPETMPRWKHRRITGGGVLLDLASHHIDTVRWLLDDDVAVTYASVHSDRTEGDHAVVELVTGGGVTVQSLFSFRAGFADRFEIAGETGTLAVDRHRGTVALRERRRVGYGDRPVRLAPSIDLAGLQLMRLAGRTRNPSYARALGAFVGYAGGGALQGASLEDGRRSLDTVLAAETFACASSS